MKRTALFFAAVIIVANLWSQETGSKTDQKENRNFRIPLIGEKAPSFSAESTNGTLNFPSDYGLSWKILFAHPQDFTPVCSSELLELAYLQNEFEKLGAKIIVVSTDKLSTHVQWKKALEQLDYKGREKAKIRFPLVDDINLEVSKKYGMIHAASNSTRYVRGVFIIDPQNIIRAVTFYPLEVGRSTGEIIRTVAALKTVDRKDVMTPSDWMPGDDVVVPFVPTAKAAPEGNVPEGYYRIAWFMTYKKTVN